MRKTAIACGVIGVIFLAAAGLLAFWITPAFVARLPADSNTTRTYAGQIQSVVNPAALKQGNFAAAIRTGLPQTIHRQVRVLQTSGNTALVKDASTVTTSGQRIGALTEQYAVDRTSLEATSSHPSGWHVTNAKGLTVSWPIPAAQHNYTGWEHFTQTTATLKYVRQEQHGGISTYVYQASIPPTKIRNSQVLSVLPASLPVSVLSLAARAGLITQSQLAALRKALPNATTVPLGYTYEGATTYWVDPATGIVVDLSTTEKESGGLALPGGQVVPVLPVLADTYKGTQASVQAAVTDAKNGGGTITLLGLTLPVIFAAVGFVLLVLAVVLWLRRPAGAHAA